MLTGQNKIGLVLALLLGLSDIAILGALSGGDDSEKPPIVIVVISVALGLATLVVAAMAWRSATWPLMIAVIVLRAISGVGDLAGMGQSAGVVIISLILLGVTVIDLLLLRNWIRKPRARTA
jgi:hypothetical protein